jgi:hypothetical protein
MAMFFFDEAGELEEYQDFRKKDQPLELEYEKTRAALYLAEKALKEHPEDPEKAAKVRELQERMGALEKQAPWLTLGYPLEYLLWGPPH